MSLRVVLRHRAKMMCLSSQKMPPSTAHVSFELMRYDVPLHSVEFWNSRVEISRHLGRNVKHVDATPVRVRQRNCEIRSLRLVLEDDTEHHVVAKDTTLHRERFRDDVHYQRTKRAYEVEIEFYKHLAGRLEGTEARTASCYYSSVKDADVLLIMEDLSQRCEASSMFCERECQRAVLNEEDAKKALEWLADFHSAFLGGVGSECVWDRGAYWSLEKRQKEWEEMTEEWEKTCRSFERLYPLVFGQESVRRLAANLASVAEELDSELDPEPEVKTLLHGDFKTANLFFLSEGVAACDFQWVGPGLGVVDVIYLLFSSVQQDVIFSKEQDLLYFYYRTFLQKVAEKGIRLEERYTWSAFQRHAELAYLDYVRFTIGSMWGSVTPTSHEEMGSQFNVGMHYRHPDYLVRMVKKAEQSLSVYSRKRLVSFLATS